MLKRPSGADKIVNYSVEWGILACVSPLMAPHFFPPKFFALSIHCIAKEFCKSSFCLIIAPNLYQRTVSLICTCRDILLVSLCLPILLVQVFSKKSSNVIHSLVLQYSASISLPNLVHTSSFSATGESHACPPAAQVSQPELTQH